jgi:hypothetical protein
LRWPRKQVPAAGDVHRESRSDRSFSGESQFLFEFRR